MKRECALLVLAGLMVPVASGAAAQEVGSAKVVPIQVSGDPAARFSLVILGDGYTAAELPRFREHVDKHLNILWSLEPFRSYRNYINVYAVEIVSGESGITCDPEIRQPKKTPLAMEFGGGCTNPNARGISVNTEAARRYAGMATPAFDQILTIANVDTYGGLGGATATTSGGNALGPYITPHELGHSLGRLQDEYTYSTRGVPGAAFSGPEPASIHHTLLTEEQMRTEQKKWFRWLGEPGEAGGIIGRHAGGQSRTSGIWRPSKHSMMISLGYYFDQVSRERMTQRISGQVNLIAASTPTDAPVSANEVIWIETAHPVFHELNVSWELNGKPVASADHSLNLPLGALGLGGGERVSVKVTDPTDFVRDPVIRDTSFTATRTWTIGVAPTGVAAVRAAFTASTQTARALSGTEVVHVETTHPAGRVLDVAWRLDGKLIANPANGRSFPLARQNLSAGRHTLSATVTDPVSAGEPQSLNWQVDQTGPTVQYTLSQSLWSVLRPDGSRHVFMRDKFTMKLEATDDQPGYLVAEFRVNGDGWHHYYGWPDAPPGTPYLFTPRGTTIKELVYGSLSAEGLSPQPWEAREPGWGTHRIEYRARDAAGNIGAAKDFRVTFMPSPECRTTIKGEHAGPLLVGEGVTCLDGATVGGTVTVSAGASLVATNSRINGALDSNNASLLELIGTTVTDAMRVAGTTGGITFFGSRLMSDVLLDDNRTAMPATLSGNTIGGTLVCNGNNAAPTSNGTPNIVGARVTGQCVRT